MLFADDPPHSRHPREPGRGDQRLAMQKHLVGAVPTPILPTQRLADAAPGPVS
jgi:hypothetical protein